MDARAIWVDGLAGDAERRIHVYDRGERYTLTVEGKTDPREHVRLGPRGRGLLARAGDQRGVWIDLEDGRQLPLLFPPLEVEGSWVQFAAPGDALWWRDKQSLGLRLIPLAPGLALERDGEGGLMPLADETPFAWALPSADAPIMLLNHGSIGGSASASLVRYPTEPDDELALVRVAAFDELLPLPLWEPSSCMWAQDCRVSVSISPDGERVIAGREGWASWLVLDRRTPQAAGLLELPEALVGLPGLGLLAVLDRSLSVWINAGRLHRWDHDTGHVGSVPLFAKPPLYWVRADRGRALVLLSTTGPMYRIDDRQLETVTLETTDCALASGPVIAPGGRWAAWTCRADELTDTSSGAVIRVSQAGIERHAGIAMAALAIDDTGELLLNSVESNVTDLVDGVSPSTRPRSLFVLSSSGELARIDELEPAPTPVDIGELAVYLQAAAL